jgi:hypothetical protein
MLLTNPPHLGCGQNLWLASKQTNMTKGWDVTPTIRFDYIVSDWEKRGFFFLLQKQTAMLSTVYEEEPLGPEDGFQ